MRYEISDKIKLLYKILCVTDRIYYSLLNKMEVTDSEYTLLFALLVMGEGSSQKEIANMCHISKKTLNSTVKKLEKEELIAQKPGKYPNMHIYLTEKGKQYVDAKLFPIMQAENSVLETVSDDDFNTFADIALKYLDKFEEDMDINTK